MNWPAEVEALRDRLNETAKRSRAAAERDRAPTLAKQAVMEDKVDLAIGEARTQPCPDCGSEQRQEARREERTRIVALIKGKRHPLADGKEPLWNAGFNVAIDDCLRAIQEGDTDE